MSTRRNAVLAGLAAGCLVFACLAAATSLPILDAVLLSVTWWPQAPPPPAEPAPVAVVAPPPPAPLQTQPITGIRLPTAHADYHFWFAASVTWRPSAPGVRGADVIAVNECRIRCARRAANAAEHFDAFLDSLNPAPSDDIRLMLTNQVARLVNDHDQKAADEMCRRHDEPDAADFHWGNPGEAEGTLPE